MKAFVEHLSGIVRVGPDCEKYGDPFDGAVAFSSIDGETAMVKALVSGGGLNRDHVRAVVAALNDIGLAASWVRYGR